MFNHAIKPKEKMATPNKLLPTFLIAKNYFKMKRNYFLLALLTLTTAAFAQKTIILNGGQFGNPSENVTVTLYDPLTKQTTIIDTIQTQSVQEVLIDLPLALAFVAAQDSIVTYDLVNQRRIAASSFPGPSTKTMAFGLNELIVGNWYGKSSSNLYFYNLFSLNLVDSVPAVSKGAKSMVVSGNSLYVAQNTVNANFTDTLGYIIEVDISSKTVIDTITHTGYTEEIGELILKRDFSGFYAVNSGSNTILSYDFGSGSATLNSVGADLRVGNRSQYTVHDDTLFASMNNGIGSIDLSSFSVLDSNLIDTVVTAFTYDTTNGTFYVTQTDFFSFSSGRVYDRAGNRTDTLQVGFSPEVVRMYYDQFVGIDEEAAAAEVNFFVYPNPATDFIQIEKQTKGSASFRLFDQQGRLVQEMNLINQSTTLNVEDLPSGLYFIELSTQQKRFAKPIIIQ